MIVVTYHAEGATNAYFGASSSWFHFGAAGVQFFFVLSGYIIYHVHFNDIGAGSEKIFGYIRKRAVRVYPVYIFITLLLTPFWLWQPSFGELYHKDVGALLMSLVLLPQNHFPHLGVAWTLIHEMLFYIVFGVLIFNRKLGIGIFSIWFVLIIVINLVEAPEGRAAYFLSINNLLFGFGVLAAWLSKRRKIERAGTALLFFVLGNMIFISVGAWTNRHDELSSPILAFGLASFLIVMQAQPLNFLFAKRRIMLFLGDASYSIYLLHYPAISAMCKVLKSMEFSSLRGALMISIVVGIVSGVVLHLTVERPMLRFLVRSR
jgi:peptidoglycan/LPS O-acetylase OafA/YrhL